MPRFGCMNNFKMPAVGCHISTFEHLNLEVLLLFCIVILESSARSGGKVPWRSSGGQKAREPVVIEDDEESWDLPNPNNNTGK